MSIATELQNYNNGLLDAYTAVNTKGGTVPEAKNLDNLDTAIASIPAGGTPDVDKDIRFYDYDGTLVEAWTLAELQEKTELPANPTHAGLTALGWNWTLAQLKTENRRMTVGQMYEPTDGAIHIFVDIYPGNLEVAAGLNINGSATIDWGDSTSTDTMTGSSIYTTVYVDHTYAAPGSYEITIAPTEGTQASLTGSNNSYLLGKQDHNVTNATLILAGIKELWCPTWVSCSVYAFYGMGVERLIFNNLLSGASSSFNCASLKTLILPVGANDLGTSSLTSMHALRVISLPYGFSSLGTYLLSNVQFVMELNLPSTLTTIGNGFCTSLRGTFTKPLEIPSSVTSIGREFFSTGFSLTNLIVNTTAHPTDTSSLTANAAYLPQFNIVLTGSQVSAWMTDLPNNYATPNPLRNLIDGTA